MTQIENIVLGKRYNDSRVMKALVLRTDAASDNAQNIKHPYDHRGREWRL